MNRTKHKALTDLSGSLCKVCGPKLGAWLDEHKVTQKRAKRAAAPLEDGQVGKAEFVRALTECAKVARRAKVSGYAQEPTRVAFAALAGGALRIRATDGEVFVRRDFDGVISEPMSPWPERVVDAAPMLRWLKVQRGKALVVEVGEGAVAFGVGDLAMAFTFLPTTEDGGSAYLPSVPDGDWATLATMPAAEALEMFRRTAFAASSKEMRYAVNAVHLEASGKKGKRVLEAVATDGRRLAVVGPLKADAKGEALVPLSAVASIWSFLRGDETEVSLSVLKVKTASFFRAETPPASVVARCVDGRFPSYREVYPKSIELKAVANKAALVDALKSVSAFRDEEWRAVVMEMGEGEIILNPSMKEHKDKRFSVPARVEGGMEWKRTGWNPDFLLDALAVLDDGEEVTLGFGLEGGSPTMVLSQGNLRYILKCVGLRGEPEEESP